MRGNPVAVACLRGGLGGVFITVLLLSLQLGLARSVAIWVLFMAWDALRSWENLVGRDREPTGVSR